MEYNAVSHYLRLIELHARDAGALIARGFEDRQAAARPQLAIAGPAAMAQLRAGAKVVPAGAQAAQQAEQLINAGLANLNRMMEAAACLSAIMQGAPPAAPATQPPPAEPPPAPTEAAASGNGAIVGAGIG